jgi:hypothetical protein
MRHKEREAAGVFIIVNPFLLPTQMSSKRQHPGGHRNLTIGSLSHIAVESVGPCVIIVTVVAVGTLTPGSAFGSIELRGPNDRLVLPF